MATAKVLRARWTSAERQPRTDELHAAIDRRASRAELQKILEGLPHASEVAPELDFRGLELRYGISLTGLDLTKARLDGAKLIGNIYDCVLVDAVLDGFDATRATMKGDFTGASIVGAKLRECWFEGSVLRRANFTRAALAKASLKGCDCTGARFNEANLKSVDLSKTQLAGADLSGATLTEAWLSGASFDEHTLTMGASFQAAQLDEGFARAAGVLRETGEAGRREGWDLAHFDAVVAELKEKNADGHLTPLLGRLAQLRPEVIANWEFDWSSVVSNEFDEAIGEEIAEAIGDADVAMHL